MKQSYNEILKELNMYGIRAKDLAKELNVSPATISLVVRGKTTSKRVQKHIEKRLKQARRDCLIAKFMIYKNGKHIDTVFFLKHMSAQEVKDALCIHDAYPENIEVVKFKLD